MNWKRKIWEELKLNKKSKYWRNKPNCWLKKMWLFRMRTIKSIGNPLKKWQSLLTLQESNHWQNNFLIPIWFRWLKKRRKFKKNGQKLKRKQSRSIQRKNIQAMLERILMDQLSVDKEVQVGWVLVEIAVNWWVNTVS